MQNGFVNGRFKFVNGLIRSKVKQSASTLLTRKNYCLLNFIVAFNSPLLLKFIKYIPLSSLLQS